MPIVFVPETGTAEVIRAWDAIRQAPNLRDALLNLALLL
jgi:hypothetical protein